MRLRPELALAPLLLISLASCGAKPEDKPGGGAGTIYMNGETHAYVYSFDLGTGQTSKLVLGQDPYFTPEGTILCSNTNSGDLGEFSVDGTTFRTIVKNNHQAPYDVTFDDKFQNPQLSPSGKFVAYEGQFGYRFDVYVVDRATGALLAAHPPVDVGVGFVRPTWTPDERLVVAGANNNPGLYISDPTWKTFTRFDPNLAAPDGPAVSPDGKTVAFVLNDHIFTIGIDGTGVTQVTKSTGKESMPTWSPDGRQLAIYQDAGMAVIGLDGTLVLDLGKLNDQFMIFTAFKEYQFSWR